MPLSPLRVLHRKLASANTSAGFEVHRRFILVAQRRQCQSLSLGEDKPELLQSVLANLEEPSKDMVRAQSMILGKRRIPAVIGDDFRWEPRGSMFSPHYHHVSDIDLHYFRAKRIEKESVDALVKHRSKLGIISFSILRRCSENEDTEDLELPWGSYRQAPAAFWHRPDHEANCEKGLRAVVLTGVVKVSGGWMVPIDITLSSEKEKSEPIQSRIAKLQRNVERGKSWKALQRLRALLGAVRCQRGRTRLRDELAEAINSELGRLRFLLTQLHLFQRTRAMREARPTRHIQLSSYIDDTNYFVSKLGLPADVVLDDLQALCKAELSRRSDAILLRYKDRIVQSLWHPKVGVLFQ